MERKKFLRAASGPLALLILLIAGITWLTRERAERKHDVLHVMSYSSFVSAWGPAPELAKLWKAQTGLDVEFQDASDAGLILEKMKLFPVDAVIGLDQLSLDDARERQAWRQLPESIASGAKPFNEFLPIDYAAVGFIFREGEIEPPKSLSDLADPRFRGAIALQDPRSSSPGMLFFFWVLDRMGVEEGFKFLESLKPNVAVVASGWSGSYGAFTKGRAKTALSFVTSPAYHWSEEKDRRYHAAVFEEGHPIQTEYAAIPIDCRSCETAERFLSFLRSPEAQAIIMQKNVMFPIDPDVRKGTVFTELNEPQTYVMKSLPELQKRRAELFERWRAMGL
ncbi:MAG: thiamine ABC transporter substrate-binding protein [Bdellovibrionota bacterium]